MTRKSEKLLPSPYISCLFTKQSTNCACIFGPSLCLISPFIRLIHVWANLLCSTIIATAWTSIIRSVAVRVDMVEMIHDNLLTQWRHILMGQFRTNIFLIPITYNCLWASEVFKNHSLKSQLLSSVLSTKYANQFPFFILPISI